MGDLDKERRILRPVSKGGGERKEPRGAFFQASHAPARGVLYFTYFTRFRAPITTASPFLWLLCLSRPRHRFLREIEIERVPLLCPRLPSHPPSPFIPPETNIRSDSAYGLSVIANSRSVCRDEELQELRAIFHFHLFASGIASVYNSYSKTLIM